MTRAPDRACNAFGRALREPQTRAERIDTLRRLAGALQADASIEVRWLGAAISRWLREGSGSSLERTLGVEGAPQAVARERRDVALLRFAGIVGCDRRAARVLAGLEPCPPAAVAALDDLRALGVVVATDRTLRRARRRTREGAAGVRA